MFSCSLLISFFPTRDPPHSRSALSVPLDPIGLSFVARSAQVRIRPCLIRSRTPPLARDDWDRSNIAPAWRPACHLEQPGTAGPGRVSGLLGGPAASYRVWQDCSAARLCLAAEGGSDSFEGGSDSFEGGSDSFGGSDAAPAAGPDTPDAPLF